MVAAVEGQVLGGGQRAAGREYALDYRVGGHVEEHDRAAERAGLGKVAAEEVGRVVLDAHGAENYDELALVIAYDMGLADYLGGQLVVRKAGAGEYGQLLPADKRAGGVYGADAGEDAALGVFAADGVYGRAVDVAPVVGVYLAEAVGRAARAVEHAA